MKSLSPALRQSGGADENQVWSTNNKEICLCDIRTKQAERENKTSAGE
ncbi:MAG: hypothetical protein XE04_1854 [Marinimicrobia bacterium 46_43]|nr:MAG: hypothetical protein XE04_1854 [Marinimicrobia bacterium 46_43]